MTADQLPAVATNFFTFCKKCDSDRYHKVLAHTATGGAKLDCEVCHSKKTWKPESAKPKKASTGAGRGSALRAAAAAKSAAKHEEAYSTSMAAAGDKALDYKMSSKFQTNQKISHPKFGVGVVLTAQTDKIEIIFKDEVRSLVHNRV